MYICVFYILHSTYQRGSPINIHYLIPMRIEFLFSNFFLFFSPKIIRLYNLLGFFFISIQHVKLYTVCHIMVSNHLNLVRWENSMGWFFGWMGLWFIGIYIKPILMVIYMYILVYKNCIYIKKKKNNIEYTPTNLCVSFLFKIKVNNNCFYSYQQ